MYEESSVRIMSRQEGSIYRRDRLLEKNITDNCSETFMPDVQTYFSALEKYSIVLVVLGALAVVICIVLFIDTARSVARSAPKNAFLDTVLLLTVYPIAAIGCFVGICLPRTHLFSEAITQGAFMFAAYRMFCILVHYCGGETKIVEAATELSLTLNMRTTPLCCWKFCILPSPKITKRRISYLRYAILQLPIVQMTVYVLLIILWAEEEMLYQDTYVYFQPFVVVSLLSGMWSLTMTSRMMQCILPQHKVRIRLLVLQLVLFFTKLQTLVIRILGWTDTLPCSPPILTPQVYGNLIFNGLMLIELVLLSFWARHIYKQPLPDEYSKNNNSSDNSKMSTISGELDIKNQCIIENKYVNDEVDDKYNAELSDTSTIIENTRNISSASHK